MILTPVSEDARAVITNELTTFSRVHKLIIEARHVAGNASTSSGRGPQRGTPATSARQRCSEGTPLLPLDLARITRLVGDAGGSKVTEVVYRKQLRPVIDEGATAMNRVFPVVRGRSCSASYSPRPQTANGPVLGFTRSS